MIQKPAPLGPGADTTPTWADQHSSLAVQRMLKPSARFRSGEVVDAAGITVLAGGIQEVGAPNEVRILQEVTEGELIAVLGPRGYTFTKSLDVAGNFEITNGNELRAAQDVDSGVYSVGIAATNAQAEAGTVRTVSIHIDPNAPTNIALSGTLSVADNAAVDTVVGSLTTTDADVGDTFTYECDDDNDLFKIGGVGSAQLLVKSSLTAYNATEQIVTVTAKDSSGLVYIKDFEIAIT